MDRNNFIESILNSRDIEEKALKIIKEREEARFVESGYSLPTAMHRHLHHPSHSAITTTRSPSPTPPLLPLPLPISASQSQMIEQGEVTALRAHVNRLYDELQQFNLAHRDLEGKLNFRMQQVLSAEQAKTAAIIREEVKTTKIAALESQISRLQMELVDSITDNKVAVARYMVLESRLSERIIISHEDEAHHRLGYDRCKQS